MSGELDPRGYYLEIKGNDLILSRKIYRPVRNLPSILRSLYYHRKILGKHPKYTFSHFDPHIDGIFMLNVHPDHKRAIPQTYLTNFRSSKFPS